MSILPGPHSETQRGELSIKIDLHGNNQINRERYETNRKKLCHLECLGCRMSESCQLLRIRNQPKEKGFALVEESPGIVSTDEHGKACVNKTRNISADGRNILLA